MDRLRGTPSRSRHARLRAAVVAALVAAALVVAGACDSPSNDGPAHGDDASAGATPGDDFPDLPTLADDDGGGPAVDPDAGFPSDDAGAPSPLPGGRRFYTAAFGRFTSACATNWVRLEFMTFAADLTVVGAYWQWSQATPLTMASAAHTNPLCTSASCDVFTPPGFLDHGGTPQTGTYSIQGSELTVAWTNGYRDRWRISLPSPDVARLTWIGSTSAATHGIAYGSSYSTNSFARLGDVATALNAKAYTGRYQSAVGTTLVAGASGVGGAAAAGFHPCQAGEPSCVRQVSLHSPTVCTQGCGAYGDPEKTITYYVASANDSRKLAYENYCTCLAQGNACYAGGSHVKPMLEVIGDTGVFHGLVGVEASIRDPACAGTLAVYGYTDVPGAAALVGP